jgi:hypothetical protein
MYKLKAGEYGSNKNLIVRINKLIPAKPEYTIYISTKEGELKVFGMIKRKLLGIKICFSFWLHFGAWIKEYYKVIQVFKRIDREQKQAIKLRNKQERKERKIKAKAIKQAYNK